MWDTSSEQPVGAPFAYQEEQFVHIAFSSSGKVLACKYRCLWRPPFQRNSVGRGHSATDREPMEGSNFAFSPDDALLAIARYRNSSLRSPVPSDGPRTLRATRRTLLRSLSARTELSWPLGSKTTDCALGCQKPEAAGYIGGPLENSPVCCLTGAERSCFLEAMDGTITRWDLEEGEGD